MNISKTGMASVLAIFSGLIITIASCTKPDSEQDFGTTTIYMPQAVIRSGGVNNQYPVPTGTDSSTWNYKVDRSAGKIEVTLGAALSGPGSAAFGADVRVDSDTLQKLFASGVFTSATHVIMPTSMYTLPARVEGSQGTRTGVFKLSIDHKALKGATYAGKFLLVAVRLANPTTYPLNVPLSSAIVVIEASKMPAP
jgi:hypothetical protein